MNDLISRQAAIDVLGVFTQADALGHTPKQIVKALPSVQPERKGTRLSTVCLLCKKPAVTFNTEDDIPYTNYSYCEDCLRKGLKLLKEQKKDLPSTQPEQRWIPVGERLPEIAGWYLTTGEDGEVYMDYCDDWYRLRASVIAWMPLPEPYKEENKK